MSTEINNILDKVLELFYKYGIRGVSMDEVSAELGISKKTLYQHFGDKVTLVELAENHLYNTRLYKFNEIYKNKETALDEMMEIHSFIQTFINEYSRAFERDLKKYYPDLYLQRYIRRKEAIKNTIKSNLEKGIEEGIYREELNIEMLSDYFMSFVFFMTEYDELTYAKINHYEYFNEIFKFHSYGILSEKGIRIFKEKLKTINNN